ncbi:hypothetical protein H0H81_006715 [Sphagnurus paluster]|uniref:PH domain-containing protein n=1 Tax=Sphagnurus paluster TaxID=117069 RepID=A0A9P7FXP5_9AGAR|nr:hypothetical protein H0H81_006715 [Sphagnurus paluster]
MEPLSGGSVSLQRQRSTKHLINRYESLSPGQPHALSQRLEDDKAPRKSSFFDRRKKDKSPHRSSFRNLFSVFKKSGKEKDERTLSSFLREPQPLVADLPTFSAPPVLRSRSRKLSSSLLYLSHTTIQPPADSPILPIWASCIATLEKDCIVISDPYAQGSPLIHTIPLSNCTDVRSLARHQLNPEESTMLPARGANEELKVFEILFEGRRREKFAANSVQERAGWVSAVWDTILPSQDPVNNDETPMQTIPMTKQAVSSIPSPKRVQRPIPVKTQSYSERLLPPIPQNQKSALSVNTAILSSCHRTGSLSPISPSIYSSTRPTSRASSSRSNSPSIANLSQLSVVRQRLAQMEPNSSQSSYEGLTSRSSSKASHSTHPTTPAHSDHGSINKSLIDDRDMLRAQSGRSSAADSILDSYSDTHVSVDDLPCKAATFPMDLRPCSTVDRGHHQSSPIDSNPRPVLELLHEQAADNWTENSRDHVAALQNDAARPPEIVSLIGLEAHSTKVMKMVAKLEEQAKANGETLGTINCKMDEHWKKCGRESSEDNVKLVKEISSMRDQISRDLSHIRETIASDVTRTLSPTILSNVSASRTALPPPQVDLSGLHMKLDALMASGIAQEENPKSSLHLDVNKIQDTLAEVRMLLEKDSTQQTLQTQQQTDSVRYLNELNSWLETFVNNGTSQIQNLTSGIEQLCQNLGSNMVADVHQLTLATAVREQSAANLQASMDGLFAMLNEQSIASNAASIANLIERQRQDNEGLMRALTSEISEEIKGERLRFVEAMKEATAINVQIHVEQFKKELKREVVEMTEEVGRLHQDREAMQHQIADLFAFYTKHKAGTQPAHVVPCSSNRPANMPDVGDQRHDSPTRTIRHERHRSSGRRPLPQPQY